MSRILVVDDDIDLLEVVEMLLTRKGFTVKAISQTAELNEAIISFRPDLILLDVALGKDDGRNICTQLKNDITTSSLPVILYSGHYGITESAYNAGADDFLAKPFDQAVLLNKINRAIAIAG